MSLFFILLSFSSVAAFAAGSVDDRRIDHIVIVAASEEINGKVILDIRQFAEDLLQQENAAGREFADEEIKNFARAEIRVRGHQRCFTGNMRVLTPAGYVPIKDLKRGDKVISWDIGQQRIVINYIQTCIELKMPNMDGCVKWRPKDRPLSRLEAILFFRRRV